MTRAGLAIEVVNQIGGSKKDAATYIDAVLEGIKVGMKRDGEVKLANFGTLSTSKKDSHEATNPRTGQKVTVPEKVVPKIKFASAIKEFLN